MGIWGLGFGFVWGLPKIIGVPLKGFIGILQGERVIYRA